MYSIKLQNDYKPVIKNWYLRRSTFKVYRKWYHQFYRRSKCIHGVSLSVPVHISFGNVMDPFGIQVGSYHLAQFLRDVCRTQCIVEYEHYSPGMAQMVKIMNADAPCETTLTVLFRTAEEAVHFKLLIP